MAALPPNRERIKFIEPNDRRRLEELAGQIGAGEGELPAGIDRPPQVPPTATLEQPRIGLLAAEAMRRAAQASADEIERACNAMMAEANEVLTEGMAFSAAVREAGGRMCARIESFTHAARDVAKAFQAERARFEQGAPQA